MKTPSFKEALAMMTGRGYHGKLGNHIGEDGFHWLVSMAHEHVDELIAEFHDEANRHMRHMFLEILAEARSPKALPIFAEHLTGDEDLRTWAAYGLQLLDTKEARRILWEAQFPLEEFSRHRS